jgi:hypothetical protein
MIDDDLKALLQQGTVKEHIRLPVEVGLIHKDDDHHLVAFVGGLPVFHSTYTVDANHRQIRAGIEYIKTNLQSAVFTTVRALGREAVELPAYRSRNQAARLWAGDLALQTKLDALRRQKHEIKRAQSEAVTLEPILKSHQWRANLIKRSLAAIAELRLKKKRISQRAVAAIVYKRPERYQLDGASAQYWRELNQGFSRPAGETFAMLSKVNKTWDQLSTDEKSELNCPESKNINKLRKKQTRKKVHSA